MGLIVSKKKKARVERSSKPKQIEAAKQIERKFSIKKPVTANQAEEEKPQSSPPPVTTNVDNQPENLLEKHDERTLSYKEAAQLKPVTPADMWKIAKDTSNTVKIDLKPTTSRKGWKTIRLFVSSTFKDFHQEREVLIKEVFPDLRLWCEARKLRLIECDLRWGVPKDSTTEDTINICLSELDRCCEDNTAPFFLNLAGDRAGWIPTFEDFSFNLASQYGWIYGLSVTEMEIVHGAFRQLNPNALFLLRTLNQKEEIPQAVHMDYINEDPFLKEKLSTMRNVITSTFPETNVKHYNVTCSKVEETNDWIFKNLSGSTSEFSNMVYDFFQKRIEELYPLDPSPQDPLLLQKEAHEMFLDSRSSCVLGRDALLKQIEDYVTHGNPNPNMRPPLLVVGTAGAGKSALMAKSAHNATCLAEEGKITNMSSSEKCHVFYHFVGATPRSTDLASFLQRLTKVLRPDSKEVSTDLDTLISLSYNLMENPLTHPVIVFIDAVNQIDEDKQQYLNRWLPEKLSANVRVVISTIESTTSHQTIRTFKNAPKEIICGPLLKDSRKLIVENILRIYNKRLDDEQLEMLLNKVGSSNPLWLTLACEELRVFGKFEALLDKIKELPDDLISLEETVFERFEGETGGQLMRACVCMLEVSRHGLLEIELLALLGDEKNITVPEFNNNESETVAELEMKNLDNNVSIESTTNIEATKENITKLVQETYIRDGEDKDEAKKNKHDRAKGKQVNFLPARDWAVIYRNLKPLLRPCGGLGEGRLDFYHRSLSKAARRRYFSGEDAIKTHKYNFWHGVLADYFEGVLDMDRKAEELPYHLEKLLDNNRLIQCLMDWNVFDRLYSEVFSIDLLHSWLQCGGFGIASAVYREQLNILRNSDMPLIEYVEVVEKVYGFLTQAGQYTEALVLMEERLNDEITHLNERPDELADVYENLARCMSEIDKSFQYVDLNQLGDNKKIVEYGLKCLEYRRRLQGPENEYRCALANILISHHRSNVADMIKSDEQRQKAFEAIDEAIAVFEKLNDIGHLAECMMTKAIIDFRLPFETREKLLKQSLEYCLKGYGEKHLLTTRIYLNTGIAYENEKNLKAAFEHFLKLKEICIAVFGPSHPKTVRAVRTLEEPIYKRMIERQKRTVPETA